MSKKLLRSKVFKIERGYYYWVQGGLDSFSIHEDKFHVITGLKFIGTRHFRLIEVRPKRKKK